MNDKSYSKTIEAKVSPSEAIKKICDVHAWWGKNFEGKSNNEGNVFTVRFKNGDMYKMKIAEVTADKKIVWDVIDAHQTWVKEPTEWIGTKIIWEIKENDDGSEIHFTHLGLVPELECYDNCKQGWDYLMLQSLLELLNTGKGMPQPV
jgi:hypothetical protein